MQSVLLRALSLSLVLVIGILFRSAGLVPREAGMAVKKLALYLTVPAMIITNFSKVGDIGGEMFLVMLLGLLTNVVMLAVGMLLSRKKPKGKRALYMNCIPSYGLGTFTIPFIQNFLSPVAAVSASIFDVGNSIMCLGTTYAFTAEYLSEKKTGVDLPAFVKRLFSSPPFVTYITVYILTAVHIRIPDVVLSLIEPAASANAFMCMMMLGLLFELELKREYLWELVKLLLYRNLFAVVFALIFYFALPLDLAIRQALVLMVFSPVAATATVYAGMCGGDEGMASAASSVSIIVSLIVLTALVGAMGLY